MSKSKINEDILILMQYGTHHDRKRDPPKQSKTPEQEHADSEFAENVLNEYRVTPLDS